MTAVWIPTDVLSEALSISDRHARRLAREAKHRKRRGRNALEVELSSLDAIRPGASAKVLSIHPELAPREAVDRQAGRAAIVTPDSRSYATAPDSVRERADRRLQAVLSWREATRLRLPAGPTLAERQDAWLASFRAEHAEISVSIPSVRRWDRAFRDRGMDGLVDGNDGSGRRGLSTIPRDARQVFLGYWLDENCRSVAFAIRETRLFCEGEGIELPEADAPFYRLAAGIPRFERAAFRESADDAAKIYPYISRDYLSVPALDTIESDHHQIDVGVRCDDEECRQVHFPWLTAWMDVRSRKILSWELSIDAPNSHRILTAFRSLVENYGLPNAAYVDNGKDYRSSLGKRFWRDREGKPVTSDESNEFFENRFFALGVRVQFARPYNAKAKAIERLFRTLIEQCWKGFESYRGALGKRTKRAQRLHSNPELLPTLPDVRDAVRAQVLEYNDAPHRGQGMSGRSPNEVFDETRIARRDPERLGWAKLFWAQAERKVRNGRVSVRGLEYQITTAEHYARLNGERVRVLIDPARSNLAVILDARGAYVCDAPMVGLSPQDADNSITSEHIAAQREIEKGLRQRMKLGDPRASLLFQRAKALRPQLVARRAAEKEEREAVRIAASAGGSTTVLIPRFSEVGRDRQRRLDEETLSAASALSPEQLRTASSAPDFTDAFLAAAADEQDRAGTLRPLPSADTGDGDTYRSEMARLREERLLKQKRERGICLENECNSPMEIGTFCTTHWRL